MLYSNSIDEPITVLTKEVRSASDSHSLPVIERKIWAVNLGLVPFNCGQKLNPEMSPLRTGMSEGS